LFTKTFVHMLFQKNVLY